MDETDQVNPLELDGAKEPAVELKMTLRKSYLTNDETSGDERGPARGKPKRKSKSKKKSQRQPHQSLNLELKKTSLPPKARLSSNVPGIIMKASDLIGSDVITDNKEPLP